MEKPPPRVSVPGGQIAVAVACPNCSALPVALASVIVSFLFFRFLAAAAFLPFFLAESFAERQSA